MVELSAAQVAKLEQSANEASVIRSFVQHPGYAIFVREIEKRVADKKQSWLVATSAAEAEELRLSAKPWGEILHFAKSFIIRGDQAKLRLPESQESELKA